MRRPRRKPQHYYAHTLNDGTVLGVRPVRKPLPKAIKRDKLRIDEEGVCREFPLSMKEVAEIPEQNRPHFRGIMANRLNMRRALRELVLPELLAVREEIAAMRTQLDRIERLLGERP